MSMEQEIKAINDRMDAFETFAKNQFATKDDLKALRNLLLDENGQTKLVTKEDIGELMEAFKNFTAAFHLISGATKWLYRSAVAVALFIAAWSVITGDFRQAGEIIKQNLFGN